MQFCVGTGDPVPRHHQMCSYGILPCLPNRFCTVIRVGDLTRTGSWRQWSQFRWLSASHNWQLFNPISRVLQLGVLFLVRFLLHLWTYYVPDSSKMNLELLASSNNMVNYVNYACVHSILHLSRKRSLCSPLYFLRSIIKIGCCLVALTKMEWNPAQSWNLKSKY